MDMHTIEHDEKMSQKNILAALCAGSPTRFWNGTLFTWHYVTHVQYFAAYVDKNKSHTKTLAIEL
jgi:hypothetical protein